MAKVAMSLYEAITRRKTYLDRLSKFDISSKAFFGYYSKQKESINGVTLDEAAKVMKGNFDSFIHLHKNIVSLQIAINKANLENSVIIPGFNNDEPVLLVEAITRKQKLAEWNKYINVIAQKLSDITDYIEDNNRRILDPKNVFDQVSKIGTTDKKSEDTAETLEKMIENFKEKNRLVLFDPNGIYDSGWVEKQRAEIDNFTAHLHTALVKANSEIMVEVELED